MPPAATSRWSCPGSATVARVVVRAHHPRPSLPQQCPERVPSIRRRAHSPQGFQPFLGVVDFEDVHPAGGSLVEGPLQEAGLEQQVERPRDPRELVADVGGELFTAEHDPRMPREEEQQVEVARVTQTGRFDELHGQGVGRLNFLDLPCSFRKESTSDRSKDTLRIGKIMPERGRRKGLVSLISIMLPLLGCVSMGFKGLQILVVEDAPDVLDVLTMLLRIEGADVAGAGSGQEALTAFRSRHFDVVVSDLGLPDIPGEVLIRTLIAAARRPITIVVISGESQPALTRALEAGAGVIFAKPCQWGRVVTYLDGLSPAPAAA